MTVKFGNLEKNLMLLTLKSRVDTAIDGTFASAARALETDAKLNAPWTDRTGNARRTMTGESLCVPLGVKKLSVIGKMEYSPRLELSYDGRYSVLFPTVLKNADDVFRDVVNAVGGVGL